jgi:4-hydroxy-tetrahydrodipicolinate synthase
MAREPFAGIYPILQTPFTPNGALDEVSLRREVAFALECGVHGMVIPAIASEFYALTDTERERAIAIVVEEVRGRVPVIAGATAGSIEGAVEYCRLAQKLGADGVLVMPPYVRHPDDEGVYNLYKAVAKAITIPIIIQDGMAPLGTPLSIRTAARIVKEFPAVRYVKEEVYPAATRIGALRQACGESLAGVFGGISGLWLIYEMERGACGNMPFTGVADIQVRIYELSKSGNTKEAWRLQKELLPMLAMYQQYSTPLSKLVLQRRGVFASIAVRDPQSPKMDDADVHEVERLLEELEPLFTVR